MGKLALSLKGDNVNGCSEIIFNIKENHGPYFCAEASIETC